MPTPKSQSLPLIALGLSLLLFSGCSTSSGRYYDGPMVDRELYTPAVDHIYVSDYVEGFVTTTGSSDTKVRLRGPEELVDSYAVIESRGSLYIRPQRLIYSAEPLEITIKLPHTLRKLEVNGSSLMRINPEVILTNDVDLHAEDNSRISAQELRSTNRLTLTAYDNSVIDLQAPHPTEDIFANADDYSSINYRSLRDLNTWHAMASLHSKISLTAQSVVDSTLEAKSNSRILTKSAPSLDVTATATQNSYISVKGTTVTASPDSSSTIEEF